MTLTNLLRIAKMSTKSVNRDHLLVTAKQTRENTIFSAKVVEAVMLSRNIKSISLKVEEQTIRFRSGQWVDFFAESLPDCVGGYSICSSIAKLNNERVIDLAVKLSNYPIAKWIHEKCSVGDEVRIRIGGEFIYDPDSEYLTNAQSHDLLLVAGGVGINPIYSILQHALHAKNGGAKVFPSNVYLLYSAKSLEDLIFRDKIYNMCEKYKANFNCKFFLTEECNNSQAKLTIQKGRITPKDILQATSSFQSALKLAYICGPVDMLTFVESVLLNASFDKENIKYEKWW